MEYSVCIELESIWRLSSPLSGVPCVVTDQDVGVKCGVSSPAVFRIVSVTDCAAEAGEDRSSMIWLESTFVTIGMRSLG